MKGFSLKDNMSFIRKLLPIPYGFLKSDVKKVSFVDDALEITLNKKIHNDTCDGFVIPGSLVKKKILPIIGITGLLLKDYMNDNLGSYTDAMQSLVTESIMRNVCYFIFYIPMDSSEVVDILPMFDKDLMPLDDDFTDIESNYMLYSPLPCVSSLIALTEESESLAPKDVTVTSVDATDDKFEMDFTVDDTDSTEIWARNFTLKMPVSSSTPQSLNAYLSCMSFPFAFVLTANFAKGKYENLTVLERFERLGKYRDVLANNDADWHDAYTGMMDWDKVKGKPAEFLSNVNGNLVELFPQKWSFKDVCNQLKMEWSQWKSSASLCRNISKCLGYMLSWQMFGCRSCEHLPKDV